MARFVVNPENDMAVYAVSKVRLDKDGRVTEVFWGPVDTDKNAWASPEQVSPVKDVVAALRANHDVYALFPSTHGHVPERSFMVAEYGNGLDTIALRGEATHEREIHDMDRLDD